MISITIDPEHDTPRQLRKYADRIGARAGWQFLTGPWDAIVAVQRAFDANYPGNNKMYHRPLTFLRATAEGPWVRFEGLAGRSAEWQAYHSANHTTASDLAKLATNAQPGLLVLYHQLFSGVTDAELLAEIRAGYAGKVVSGQDLQRFPLPMKSAR